MSMRIIGFVLVSCLTLFSVHIKALEYKVIIIQTSNKDTKLYPKKINNAKQVAGIYYVKNCFSTAFVLDHYDSLQLLSRKPSDRPDDFLTGRKSYWDTSRINIIDFTDEGDVILEESHSIYLIQKNNTSEFGNYFNNIKGSYGDWKFFGDTWTWENGEFTRYDTESFKQPFLEHVAYKNFSFLKIHDVNKGGVMAGEYSTQVCFDPTCLFTYSNEQLNFIKLQPGMYLVHLSINDEGIVMFRSDKKTGVWNTNTGSIVMIPGFEGNKINNSSAIIGKTQEGGSPAIWKEGKITKLQEFLVEIIGLTRLAVLDINDHDDILCEARVEGRRTIIILEHVAP